MKSLFSCALRVGALLFANMTVAQAAYTEFTVPVSLGYLASVNGMNDAGLVVGSYSRSGNEFGYIYDGVNFTTLAVSGVNRTVPTAINSSGTVVGYCETCVGGSFIYRNGVISTYGVGLPGVSYTSLWGINDAGDLAGFFSDASGAHGFIDDGTNVTVLDYPGAGGTLSFDINNIGVVVGRYDSMGGSQSHGFIFDGDNYRTLDVPGGSYQATSGSNDDGFVVGIYNNGDAGYFYDGTDFRHIKIEGSFFTELGDINNLNQITGLYSTGSRRIGFIADAATLVAPLPPPVFLLSSGCVALAFGSFGKRSRKRNGNRLSPR